jgi:hypothetical protein
VTRSLRLYVTGLVITSVVALAVASYVYGLRPNIALQLDDDPTSSSTELLAGLAFWTF